MIKGANMTKGANIRIADDAEALWVERTHRVAAAAAAAQVRLDAWTDGEKATPGAVLVAAMIAILDARGEPSDQRSLAALLGVRQPNISRSINGAAMRTSTIESWLSAWESAGYPRLDLATGPGGWRLVLT